MEALGTEKTVTIYTDHPNLQHFLTTKKWSRRRIPWVQALTKFNFKIVYQPGTRGGKPAALSRWPEYCPEEGATHSVQSILKAEHFQASLVQSTIEEDEGIEIEDSEIWQEEPVIRIKKLSEDATIPTKGSRMAAGHDLYALKEIPLPAK